jgi:hypothetical protein
MSAALRVLLCRVRQGRERPYRSLQIRGSVSICDPADIDVVAIDRPSLAIGVAIATGVRRGDDEAIFSKVKCAPVVPRIFRGTLPGKRSAKLLDLER